MEHLGWQWNPTMTIGSGCTIHLAEDELPKGRIVVSLSRHCAAVIDGVLHDTYDCSRDGNRCVYGYYSERKPASSKTHYVMSVNNSGWTMFNCGKGSLCHKLSSKCVAVYDHDEAMRIAEKCRER